METLVDTRVLSGTYEILLNMVFERIRAPDCFVYFVSTLHHTWPFITIIANILSSRKIFHCVSHNLHNLP